jgi:hypothetical protein
MSYKVEFPDEISQQIQALEAPPEIKAETIQRVIADLEYGHETTCFRLAAPSPTFVFNLDLPDPVVPGVEHWFVFYLTYGSEEDTLEVQQFSYERHEPWNEDDRSSVW